MKRFYLLMCLCCSLLTSRAQETVMLSLNDCMDYALKHNYAIKNAQIDVLIQQAQNAQVTSNAMPHISGKAELDNFQIPQVSFVGSSSFPGYQNVPYQIIPISFTLPYASSAGLSASQVVFDGSVFVALQARNTVMELARQNGEVTEENIRYNVYKAYNSLVIAYRQYDIIKQSLAFARSLEHDVNVMQETGFGEKIDVERTAVQVNNMATDSISIENLLAVSSQVLKYYMGMDLNTPIQLTDTAVELRRQAALDLLATDESYARVPEFNALNTALHLNEYNVKRYKYAALPSLGAFGAYGINTGSNKFNDLLGGRNYWANATIGLQLNMALFNGLMRVNQLKEANLNVEKSKNNLENMKQTIDFQTAQSKTNLKNMILELQSQKRNLALANDVLDLAQKKYKAGVGSNSEVTTAQTDQLRAQNNYFSALLNVINAEADLKKALGLLKS